MVSSGTIASWTVVFLAGISLLAFYLNGRSKTNNNKHLAIVLGSGGHTGEMMRMVSNLGSVKTIFNQRTYVTVAGDMISLERARKYEKEGEEKETQKAFVRYIVVPRARSVGQSWLSSPFSAARCFIALFRGFQQLGCPSVVLCNGPGVCVLVCFVVRLLSIPRYRPKIVYVESFARVETLSLSGKILLRIADRFIVQWPQLKAKYPTAEYFGLLV